MLPDGNDRESNWKRNVRTRARLDDAPLNPLKTHYENVDDETFTAKHRRRSSSRHYREWRLEEMHDRDRRVRAVETRKYSGTLS